MIRVQKIVADLQGGVIVMNRVKEHFDVGLYRFFWIIGVAIFIAGGTWFGVTNHTKSEDFHLDLQENIMLSEVPDIMKDVENLSHIVLSNERGLLVVETKLIDIEKKIDRILVKLE